jgi:hypothetical protein
VVVTVYPIIDILAKEATFGESNGELKAVSLIPQ